MNITGYKKKRESKTDLITIRMDKSMVTILNEIGSRTGISKSELIREGVRKVFDTYSSQISKTKII